MNWFDILEEEAGNWWRGLRIGRVLHRDSCVCSPQKGSDWRCIVVLQGSDFPESTIMFTLGTNEYFFYLARASVVRTYIRYWPTAGTSFLLLLSVGASDWRTFLHAVPRSLPCWLSMCCKTVMWKAPKTPLPGTHSGQKTAARKNDEVTSAWRTKAGGSNDRRRNESGDAGAREPYGSCGCGQRAQATGARRSGKREPLFRSSGQIRAFVVETFCGWRDGTVWFGDSAEPGVIGD